LENPVEVQDNAHPTHLPHCPDLCYWDIFEFWGCVTLSTSEDEKQLGIWCYHMFLADVLTTDLYWNWKQCNKNKKKGKYVWTVSNYISIYLRKRKYMTSISTAVCTCLWPTLKWEKRINITKWIILYEDNSSILH
jgi:hypothetical protein